VSLSFPSFLPLRLPLSVSPHLLLRGVFITGVYTRVQSTAVPRRLVLAVALVGPQRTLARTMITNYDKTDSESRAVRRIADATSAGRFSIINAH